MRRLFEVGSRGHELRATDVERSLYDLLEVVFVTPPAMVHSSKDWITEIDAYLPGVSITPKREGEKIGAHQRT
jgi:hypothetical protein